MSTPEAANGAFREGALQTGAFVPDAAAIARLANAFFNEAFAGGAPSPAPVPAVGSTPPSPSTTLAASALPAQPPIASAEPPTGAPPSPPAPWNTPPTPSTTLAAGLVPVQPPFGGVEPPTGAPGSGVFSPFAAPLSSPAVASPAGFAATSPAFAGAAPFAAPIGDGDFARLSPFAAEIDFERAFAAFGFVPVPQTVTGEALPASSAPASPPRGPSEASQTNLVRPSEAGTGRGLFDAAAIREDFPILREEIHGRRLIWLDNGATTQKPQAVIDRLAYFYAHENSNVHRGAHALAARATDAYEAARDKARRFVGAASPDEIVFVRGATEAINLVAQAWGRRNVSEGDEIVITWLEHHANIVPWQQLCATTGAKLKVAPVDDNGDVLVGEYERLLGPRTRLVAIPQVSNALGTVVPVAELIAAAHRHGALALVDGAQSVSHMPTDVRAIDADFFVFSGHKMFAPTGIGALYGKADILEATPPWQGGGSMIADVTFEKTAYRDPPDRFEAGTGNIADAVGLGAAIDYLEPIGMERIARHEHELIAATVAGLGAIKGVRLVGAPRERAGVVSFVVDNCRSEDVGRALDREGIAVRAGHHCAQPILRRFGLETTVRPSFAVYNTHEDVEALVSAVRRIAAQAHGGSR